jgi:hypothetical protein
MQRVPGVYFDRDGSRRTPRTRLQLPSHRRTLKKPGISLRLQTHTYATAHESADEAAMHAECSKHTLASARTSALRLQSFFSSDLVALGTPYLQSSWKNFEKR